MKLASGNYLLWKTQILPVLRYHGLLGFVDGTLAKPKPSSNQVTEWVRLDHMVLGWLLISLSDVVLSQVVDKYTSRDVWLILEILYGTQSRARIQQLKTELQSLVKGSLAIHSYVQHAKSLSLALASAGKPVDDDDLILWTLCGLGSEFDPIVAAINSRPTSPTFAEVYGLLLDYELRLNSSSSLVDKSIAFTTTQSPYNSIHATASSAPSPQGQSLGRYSSSRKRGRGGRGSSRGRGRTSPNAPIVCYHCGYPYHKANNCWAPTDVIDSSTKAMNAMTLAAPDDPNWYLDTGATHTMTPNANQVSGHEVGSASASGDN